MRSLGKCHVCSEFGDCFCQREKCTRTFTKRNCHRSPRSEVASAKCNMSEICSNALWVLHFHNHKPSVPTLAILSPKRVLGSIHIKQELDIPFCVSYCTVTLQKNQAEALELLEVENVWDKIESQATVKHFQAVPVISCLMGCLVIVGIMYISICRSINQSICLSISIYLYLESIRLSIYLSTL